MAPLDEPVFDNNPLPETAFVVITGNFNMTWDWACLYHGPAWRAGYRHPCANKLAVKLKNLPLKNWNKVVLFEIDAAISQIVENV